MKVTEYQITAAARALSNDNADICNVNREDNWMLYGDSFRETAKIALEAAFAEFDNPENTGVGTYCQPGDQSEPRWLLKFDDAERGACVYETEREAREAFAHSEGRGWNCWLFSPTPRALASNKAAAVAVGEPIPGSPAYALRGLYKVADYYVEGKPVTPEQYIAWQRGIIEAITKARVPDPKYYGGSAEEGDQHEVKCAYVDGWNECRTSILATPRPSQAAVVLDDEPWWVSSLRKLWGDGTCDLDTRRAAKVACDIFDRAASTQPVASSSEAVPVAWMTKWPNGTYKIDMDKDRAIADSAMYRTTPVPLYTHPAAAQPDGKK